MTDNSLQNSSKIIYDLTQKNEQIEYLLNENSQYSKLIYNLKSENFSLKSKLSHFHNLSEQLKSLQEKNTQLENKIQKLSKEILYLKKKNLEEKRNNQNKYDEDIKKIKTESEGYKSKIEMTNYLLNENHGLMEAFDKIMKDKKEILEEQDKKLRENKIISQLKISNLKKRMIDTVNETQGKVNDLNMQYTDINTKLALLQNQQLMIKYQYQNKLFNELVIKNKSLETQNFELKKELDLHKEVEISLAEKYKRIKLKFDLGNTNMTAYNNSFRKTDNNSASKGKKILLMHKKILNLENALVKEQNNLEEEKIKNESIQKIIEEKGKKYLGIFNYLEDCLKLFFNDDYLKRKKDIYIHIDMLKKGDFSQLSKEEKYSTLIILMKYLLPLIYHDRVDNKLQNTNTKFHLLNVENNIKYLIGNKKDTNHSSVFNKKIIRKKIFKKNENNLELPFNFSFHSNDNSLNPSERLSFISTKNYKKMK